MKSLLRIGAVSAIVVMLAALIGCSSGGGAAEVKSLYASLGRADGVAKLANQFGANISANPTLSALLDAAAIDNVKTGLTNDIIKASAMTPPNDITLESSLAGKNLGGDGLSALSSCLTDAGDAMSLDSTTMASLSALLKPLSGK